MRKHPISTHSAPLCQQLSLLERALGQPQEMYQIGQRKNMGRLCALSWPSSRMNSFLHPNRSSQHVTQAKRTTTLSILPLMTSINFSYHKTLRYNCLSDIVIYISYSVDVYVNAQLCSGSRYSCGDYWNKSPAKICDRWKAKANDKAPKGKDRRWSQVCSMMYSGECLKAFLFSRGPKWGGQHDTYCDGCLLKQPAPGALCQGVL